jgi:hypothetical protein
MVGGAKHRDRDPKKEFIRQPEQNYMQRITPFLWFDDKAEEAANFYVSIFKNPQPGFAHE